MLVTKARYEQDAQNTKYELKNLNDKYWALVHKYGRLLNHLGLSEHEIPAKVELRTKGGPEKG